MFMDYMISASRGQIFPEGGGHLIRDDAGEVGEYAAATMLLDSENPQRVAGLSPHPVMRAEADFERSGYLPDIVFPTALFGRDGELDVYYGAADTAVGVTRYSLDELLASTGK